MTMTQGVMTTVGLSKGRAVLLWSVITMLTASAAILIRYCDIPAASIGFWRAFGAAAVLLPWWYVVWRRDRTQAPFSRGACLTGIFFGLHFASWAWAVQHTTIANAMLFIGIQPLLAPLVARPLLGERLTRWEGVACLLACSGMVLILGQHLTTGREALPGAIVAFVSAFLCACYFVLARKYRRTRHALLFSVPVYLTAAVVQALAGVMLDGGVYIGDRGSQLALLALILFPTVGGHTLMMYLLRHVKSQMITLSVPAQFLIGSTVAFFLFGELPRAGFLAGAVVVLAGVVLGVVMSESQAPPPTAPQLPVDVDSAACL